MFELNVSALEVLVIGEPGNGKANFVQKFLEYFPSSAEVRRRHAKVYYLYQPNQGFRIQLYDVDSVENMDRSAYDKMDVVLFYFAADNPDSLRSIEKWTSLMGVDARGEMHSSLQTKKEVLSILLVDWCSLRHQSDATKQAMANSLKDHFGIKHSIQTSSEDCESIYNVFQIMSEISRPKMNKKSSYRKESCEKRAAHGGGVLDQFFNFASSPSSMSCGDRHLDEVRKLEFSLQELQV